jgi:D-alanine-D-alanine ligase
VPYTGSGVLGSALSMDKIRTKQVWLSLGLPTPRYVRLGAGDDVHAAARALGLPVIVKPAAKAPASASVRVFGRSRPRRRPSRWPRAIRGELLMEQLIEGDELTVAVLGDVALPSIRIVPKGEWYDYHAKYVAEDTQYLCPGLEGEAENGDPPPRARRVRGDRLQRLGRVDVMRDRDGGKFYLLEVNTAPGMTSHSLVPKAARAGRHRIRRAVLADPRNLARSRRRCAQ